MCTPLINIVVLLSAAASYFYFHTQCLTLAGRAYSAPPLSIGKLVWSFIPNFFLFLLYSGLQFHLIANWTLFFVYFFVIIFLIFRPALRAALVLSLSSLLIGLGVNIICRSLTAVLLDVPLMAVDNQTLSNTNIKRYPVIVGFFLGGLLLQVMRRTGWGELFQRVVREGSNLKFLLRIFVVMYAYLVLNLFLYYVDANDLILKLWGIATVAFVLVGHMIAIRFAARLSQLNEYRMKNGQEQAAVSGLWAEERRMAREAYSDTLTRCQNRQAAELLLEAYTRERVGYCLCFLDLNRLKAVNDHFGHKAGDAYLVTVAETLRACIRQGEDRLFRYGGDEFLLVMPGCTVPEARTRLEAVNRQLQAAGEEQGLPYIMSVSYGVVGGQGGVNYSALIRQADEEMYRMKAAGR